MDRIHSNNLKKTKHESVKRVESFGHLSMMMIRMFFRLL